MKINFERVFDQFEAGDPVHKNTLNRLNKTDTLRMLRWLERHTEHTLDIDKFDKLKIVKNENIQILFHRD